MGSKALLVGNSDGIGLAMTNRLLSDGWEVTGISRSGSNISSVHYRHYIMNVSHEMFTKFLNDLVMKDSYDLCVYFVGIGEKLNLEDMKREAEIIDVNLTGMVKTASVVVPHMVKEKKGHFMGISSLVDEMHSASAPSYYASKAGFSNYLRGLALALKSKGVYVTNVRFGFVDTKMAKGKKKLLLMSVEKAVDHLNICLQKKPVSYSAPRLAVPLIKFLKLLMVLGSKKTINPKKEATVNQNNS